MTLATRCRNCGGQAFTRDLDGVETCLACGRSLNPVEPLPLVQELGGSLAGGAVRTLSLRQHEALEYLESNPGATTSEIASALQWRPDKMRQCLDGLYTRHLVRREADVVGWLRWWRQS